MMMEPPMGSYWVGDCLICGRPRMEHLLATNPGDEVVD